MALTLTAVTPAYVSNTGADRFCVSGTFDTGAAYKVQVDGIACQSGLAAQGVNIFSLDGVTLVAFAPVLSSGEIVNVTVSDAAGNTATLSAVMRVLMPFYNSEVFSLRSILPPLYDVGPRSFADLPAVDT